MGGGGMKTSSVSRPKRPSFFKVLVGDFTNKLRIPSAFLKHCNGKFPRNSILKSPSGKSCTVKMKKIEKDMFFCNGWEIFVNEHCLEFGDFLVFRYSGNFKFKVKIYGRNACEKEITPLTSKTRNHYKKKQRVDIVAKKCAKFPCFSENGFEVKGKRKKKVMTKKVASYVKQKRSPISMIERKAGVDSFDSEFSCFAAVCRPCRRTFMTVPAKVAEKNGLKDKESVQLRVPNGRLWQVKVCHKKDGRINLEQGWNEFWKDHNLGGGEICRFKFMQGLGHNVISVDIFRGGVTEYHSRKGGGVDESIRDAVLVTDSNVDINRRNKAIEAPPPERRFGLIKEETDIFV